LFNVAFIPKTINIRFFEPNDLEVKLSIPVYLNKEAITSKALILSYMLMLPFLIEYFVCSFLINIRPSLIFLGKLKGKESKDDFFCKSCEKIASEMGIKIPKIFLLKVPEIRTIGCDEKNAIIALYEKCRELKKEEIELILTHEMTHIKYDLDYYSLDYILNKFHGKFNTVTNFISFATWVLFGFEFWRVFKIMNFRNCSEIINSYLPLYIAYLSLVQAIFFIGWVSHNVAYLSPIPTIEEIRSDLVAFLHIGNINKFINAFNAWRRLQIEYFLENPVKERLRFYKIKEFFRKIFTSQRSVNYFSGWLEYLRRGFIEMMLTGKNINFTEDRLRIDFLTFIDKLVNNNVRFRLLKKRVQIGRLWDFKFLFVADKIGLYGFKRDLNRISYAERAKVIEFLITNLSNFNAKSCSFETKVKLFNVIVVIVMLLIDGQIEYLGETSKYVEN
jgi:hypothetical protein